MKIVLTCKNANDTIVGVNTVILGNFTSVVHVLLNTITKFNERDCFHFILRTKPTFPLFFELKLKIYRHVLTVQFIAITRRQRTVWCVKTDGIDKYFSEIKNIPTST